MEREKINKFNDKIYIFRVCGDGYISNHIQLLKWGHEEGYCRSHWRIIGSSLLLLLCVWPGLAVGLHGPSSRRGGREAGKARANWNSLTLLCPSFTASKCTQRIFFSWIFVEELWEDELKFSKWWGENYGRRTNSENWVYLNIIYGRK